MKDKDELIDIYGYQAEIFGKSYIMMGRLLDPNFTKQIIEKGKLSDIYIYGGGYLGIQLYRAISHAVNVLSLVDKKGKLLIDGIDDIPIMDMDTFQKQYNNQLVIVTPLKFYREIYHELKRFVSDNQIVFLEEFIK